jgi:hypothetical protein
MNLPRITIKAPHMTREGAEIVVLALIAGGVIWLIGMAIEKSGDNAGAYDLAAFLLVLQAIITAIKDRWTQRGTDQTVQTVAAMAPAVAVDPGALGTAKPAGTPDDPVHVQEEPKL